MSIHTPVPAAADVRPSRSHHVVQDSPHMASVVTRTSAVELGLVITLCGTLAAGVYAWTATRGDVDRLQSDMSDLRAATRALTEAQVQRDMALQDLRRDVSEVRSSVGRIEAAVTPTSPAVRR